MDRFELCVVLGFAFEIHLPEHVESRLFPVRAGTSRALGLDRAGELPTSFTTAEAESLAVVASGNDLILVVPDQALKRQHLRSDGNNSSRRLLWAARVYDGDAAVMRSKSEAVSTRRESYGVNPSSRVIQILAADSVKWQPLTPESRLRPLVNAFDEAGKDAGMRISRSSGQQNGVRVPVYAGDGASDGLLQVLGNPPVVLLLKVTDSNDAVARTDGKFGFGRRPAHKGSGTANSEEDKSRLISRRRRLPDQGVSIYNAG
jgi:hypothetical protein